MAAGPDEVRGSQPLSKLRARSAAARSGVLDRWIDRFASALKCSLPEGFEALASNLLHQAPAAAPINALD